ncbi:hypothetical protein GLAREA_01517 [Glarea lozoyensis ATCC 20868]|uniref:Uncharacterized protein n=1 Tax=Glarea lozoyensis (strain ATCC 20868 / MF5171) TaxID=1116229 RepID=S3CID6_GLAL2|nr:uncharacterized protein GLAREA_01517 [Glarea lozoyensis ATCC 20868]EPE25605.1 hypothetical protein GLAREA_01517 [Glarea lozoyensis ATCC 20868]
MIRLSPTAIVLGESDVRDFLQRESQRRVEAQLALLESLTVDPHSEDLRNFRPQNRRQTHATSTPVRRNEWKTRQPSISSNLNSPPRQASIATVLERAECSESSEPHPHFNDNESSTDSADDEHEQRSCLQSNRTDSRLPATNSPEKEDDFHYGGFTESPSQNNNSATSSSFGPDDFSTPQHLHPMDIRSTRPKPPLPRSPLYLSQNISMSPEPRPITALTPRVVSRVASHNSPGIIFSVPPRRPPRISPRFRHQTNSFSFDDSERSSAAYEQQRASSGSMDETTPRPDDTVSLHEELRDSSLRSSATISIREDTLGAQEEPRESTQRNPVTSSVRAVIIPHSQEGIKHHVSRRNREIIFSSPRLTESDEEEIDDDSPETRSSPNLPLPPPFSSARRSASNSEALPGSYGRPSLGASPADMPSSSPDHSVEQQLVIRGSSQLDRNDSPQILATRGSSPSSRISSTGQLIARVVSTYRAHSPLRSLGSRTPSPFQHSSPLSASPTPRIDSHGTPRDYRVYNDGLSPSTQPQTPAHLPESRHRSRFHPFWTEPTNRIASWRGRLGGLSGNHDGAGSGTSEQRAGIFATPSRRTGVRRSGSPDGMTGRGFQGLYGGRENGDDERSWLEGVRFDNAETRLWGIGDAGTTDERVLNDTPEREDWRLNIR